MNALPYLLTASLYLLLFYGCYGLLLRRNTFFGLNRAYLLASVMLSLLLPLVELPGGATNALPVAAITLPTFVVGAGYPSQPHNLPISQWLWLIYGCGVMVMLLRLGIQLRAVFILISRGTFEQKTGYTLVRLPACSTAASSIPSFSFGRYLVLNPDDALSQPAALIEHEKAHIRQHHTADVLFVAVVQAAFWFNPIVWLYKRALQEVHEFLADQAAVRQAAGMVHGQPTYAQQLVAYALNSPSTALTTPFVSVSTLKQRIVMLQKPKTHRRALLGYFLILPLAALLVMCTQSEQDQATLTTSQASPRKKIAVAGEIFTVVEQQPEFPGGMKALGAYLGKNLRYPEKAQKAHVEGRVFVRFVVTKAGEITDVQVLKGIGFGADDEAIRVVEAMPRWKPARQSGQLVNVQYNLPINFHLDDKATGSNVFNGIKTFLIDGNEVTQQAFTQLPTSKIRHWNFDRAHHTIGITTK